MEWVPGDRRWKALYLGLHVVLFGLAVVFLAAFIAGILLQAGILAASPFAIDHHLGLHAWQLPVLFLAVFALLGIVVGLRRVRPVAESVGFSPEGVAVRFPLGFLQVEAPWERVHWLDRYRVWLDTDGGRVRIVLTAQQSDRILRYLAETHRELPPAAAPGGQFTV
ncbi:MAG: hypothetical protein QXG65_06590 [Thermoplasmata archaeon]